MKRRAVAATGIASLALCSLACSVATRHAVLTFFFDGVPPLEEEGEAAAGASPEAGAPSGSRHGALPKGPRIYSHEPVREHRCGECHDLGRGMGVKEEPGAPPICIRCHPSPAADAPHQHGPAAAGACQVCHQPHRSTLPHLVREEGDALCLQCHDRNDLSGERHAAPSSDSSPTCITCHDPHGGEVPMFLRRRDAGSQG